jgi:hypothetical protein
MRKTVGKPVMTTGPGREVQYLALLAESVPFRERFAARYASALGTFLRLFVVKTIGDEREVFRAVNRRMRLHGLAIGCRKSGFAPRLVAYRGNHPERGRFQIEILGAQQRRTVSTSPPPLDLMPEPPEEGSGPSRPPRYEQRCPGEQACETNGQCGRPDRTR